MNKYVSQLLLLIGGALLAFTHVPSTICLGLSFVFASVAITCWRRAQQGQKQSEAALAQRESALLDALTKNPPSLKTKQNISGAVTHNIEQREMSVLAHHAVELTAEERAAYILASAKDGTQKKTTSRTDTTGNLELLKNWESKKNLAWPLGFALSFVSLSLMFLLCALLLVGR